MILFVALVLIYFFGLAEQKKALQAKIYVPPVVVSTPAPTEEPPVTVFPASKEDTTSRTYTVTKLHDTTFLSYSVTYPSSWELRLSESEYHRTLSLWKDDAYEIRIYQAGFGGGMCRDTSFTQIESGIGSLRKFKSSSRYSDREDVTSFMFCHKDGRRLNEYTDYTEPTAVGSISYTVPKNFDPNTIDAMDEIIKTLKGI